MTEPAVANGNFNPVPLDRDKTLSVHVLNQGHGDCIIVEIPRLGRQERVFLLIDASENANLINKYLETFLDCPADGSGLYLAVISHPHWDHYKAIPNVVKKFKPRFILISPLKSGIEKSYNRMLNYMCANQWDELGEANDFRSVLFEDFKLTAIYNLIDAQLPLPTGLNVEQLGPTAHMRQRISSGRFPTTRDFNTDINNSSVVLQLTYCGKKILLPWDLEGLRLVDGWHDLLDDYPAQRDGAPLTATLLKVPHHGSRNGCPPDVLARLQPGFAVVSCDAPSYYVNPETLTLPNQDAIQNLRAATRFTFLTNGTGLNIFSYIFCISPPDGSISIIATQLVHGEVQQLNEEVPISVDLVKSHI